MRNIYLAARYSRNPEMRDHARWLQKRGLTVTSRWILGGHQMSDDLSAEGTREERERFAQEDWIDLVDADTCISFTERPRAATSSRGGRHVEFGAALALGHRCIVVGWRENIFHCLPNVEYYACMADLMDRITEERGTTT